jgi:hypothetical protein
MNPNFLGSLHGENMNLVIVREALGDPLAFPQANRQRSPLRVLLAMTK